MGDTFSYFVVLIPLAVIIALALFFYRLFTKNMSKDAAEIEKKKELDRIKQNAELKEARIISANPESQSNTNTSHRYINLRFEIKTDNDDYKIYPARWYVDTFNISQLQPDSRIQVKVYNDYVFPIIDGARLVN